MRQFSRGLCFVDEPLPVILLFVRILSQQRDGFNRDQAVDFGIAGTIDNAHSAASNLGDDFIPSNVRAYDCFHWLRRRAKGDFMSSRSGYRAADPDPLWRR